MDSHSVIELIAFCHVLDLYFVVAFLLTSFFFIVVVLSENIWKWCANTTSVDNQNNSTKSPKGFIVFFLNPRGNRSLQKNIFSDRHSHFIMFEMSPQCLQIIWNWFRHNFCFPKWFFLMFHFDVVLTKYYLGY